MRQRWRWRWRWRWRCHRSYNHGAVSVAISHLSSDELVEIHFAVIGIRARHHERVILIVEHAVVIINTGIGDGHDLTVTVQSSKMQIVGDLAKLLTVVKAMKMEMEMEMEWVGDVDANEDGVASLLTMK